MSMRSRSVRFAALAVLAIAAAACTKTLDTDGLEGELKGQYIRFDATTSNVNGWSTFSPQHFQIDLRTTQGGPLR